MAGVPTKVKPKYRPWPKKRDGHHSVLDKDKIKQIYLSHPNPDWGDFCKAHNFNPATPRDLNANAWRREWLESQIKTQDENVMNKAVQMRTDILLHRLRYITDWGQHAEALKMIQMQAARSALEAYQFNQQFAQEILTGKVKAKRVPTAMDLSMLSKAALNIQELERNALLIPHENSAEKVLPIPEMKPEEQMDDALLEEQRNEPYPILGTVNLKKGEMTEVLAKWFDHASQQQTLETTSRPVLPETEEGQEAEETE